MSSSGVDVIPDPIKTSINAKHDLTYQGHFSFPSRNPPNLHLGGEDVGLIYEHMFLGLGFYKGY